MIYESLRIPKWLEAGIKPNHRGSRVDKIIYGGDTETVRGKPNSMQFYSEDIACNDMIFCDEGNARKKFLSWCDKRKRKVQHVVYVHNLAFDLIEFLWGTHERLIENSGEFDFSADGYSIRGIYGSPTFCTLRKGDDICVHLCDSFSFYRGSLAQAAMLYCPELPKLRRPLGLGQRKYTASSTAFVEYAMRDAQVTYHIGKSIEALHHEFDLKQCVSIADMAARIFRHSFLSYTIPQPTTEIVHASLDAYHGGKNNLTVESGIHRGVYGIDISSAYPHAMRDMPAFSDGNLYKAFRTKRGERIHRVPDYGVYRVDGTLAPCKWPALFSHAFKPLCGSVEGTWIQGFELNESISSGEFKPTKVIGNFYQAESDIQASALRGFCDDFYRRKQSEKDKIRRYGYKLILNSISGKFIQTRKRTLKTYVDCDTLDVGSASELVAGGMFHPFIAAAITAHTRARIHQLEHKYEALHTATDGIFTQRRPDRDVVSGDATQLGQLTQDAHGELLIVRNKCYIMYDKSGAKKSKAYRGKRISKYALHGFQGSVYDLERMVKTGARRYRINKPNRLKEALARGLTPNDFVEREMNLNVGEINGDF
jgi:DNA polymerase type B, organellar and viral